MNGKLVTDFSSLRHGNAVCIQTKNKKVHSILGVVVSVNAEDDILCVNLLKIIEDNNNNNLPPLVEISNTCVSEFKISNCSIFIICVLTNTSWKLIPTKLKQRSAPVN